jgi:hypothetical protein
MKLTPRKGHQARNRKGRGDPIANSPNRIFVAPKAQPTQDHPEARANQPEHVPSLFSRFDK